MKISVREISKIKLKYVRWWGNPVMALNPKKKTEIAQYTSTYASSERYVRIMRQSVQLNQMLVLF